MAAAQEAPPQQQAEQGGMLPTVVRFMFTYMLVSSATQLFRGGMQGPLPGGAPTADGAAARGAPPPARPLVHDATASAQIAGGRKREAVVTTYDAQANPLGAMMGVSLPKVRGVS